MLWLLLPLLPLDITIIIIVVVIIIIVVFVIIMMILAVPDEHEKDIDDSKKEQAELDAKIREWEMKIKDQHKNMGGVHMSSQHTTQTQKTLRVLENRLDQVRHFCAV